LGLKVYLEDEKEGMERKKTLKGREISFQFPTFQKYLHDILHLQGLVKNLMSISKMSYQGDEVSFKIDVFLIKWDNMVVKGVKYRNLYKLLGSLNKKTKQL